MIDLCDTDLQEPTSADVGPTVSYCCAQFAATALAAGEVRAFTTRELAAWGSPPTLIDATTLVASELVTNAVKAAATLSGGVVRIGLRRLPNRRVRIGVWDKVAATIPHPADSPAQPAASPDPVPESGHGMRLVASIAEAWGVSYHSSGTEVWAQVAPVPDAEPNFAPPAPRRPVTRSVSHGRGIEEAAAASPRVGRGRQQAWAA